MIKKQIIYLLLLVLAGGIACSNQNKTRVDKNINLDRAHSTMDSIYKYYSTDNDFLLAENYPYSINQTVTYLASSNDHSPNKYSFLWPYSGTLSAVNALMEVCPPKEKDSYRKLLEEKVLIGLDKYFDQIRIPYAYASYINSSEADRYYDDNIWIGIDFIDIYVQTGDNKYLDKAKLIWNFVQSGSDDVLGGGIYWCEQDKRTKNTCSNAPAAVYAFKLFEATEDSIYYFQGIDLYEWTKSKLQDPEDKTFYDNLSLDGTINKAKYAYNSGQMLQAAALLYKLTGDKVFLSEAQEIAQGTYNLFFEDFVSTTGKPMKILKRGDIWFHAIMLRGFIELYSIDEDIKYLDAFRGSLDHAWESARTKEGFFNVNLKGNEQDDRNWLLTQAAMVEMYARLGNIFK